MVSCRGLDSSAAGEIWACPTFATAIAATNTGHARACIALSWRTLATRATSAAQPRYSSTCKPAFQSLTYIMPSVATYASQVFAARVTFGRGSIILAGIGGTQYAISLGA